VPPIEGAEPLSIETEPVRAMLPAMAGDRRHAPATKGSHSVGAAPQYAAALGKNSSCETLVSATLVRGEVPLMIGLRLFLPESWAPTLSALQAEPAYMRPGALHFLTHHARHQH
jgi:SRSO17 transposase